MSSCRALCGGGGFSKVVREGEKDRENEADNKDIEGKIELKRGYLYGGGS